MFFIADLDGRVLANERVRDGLEVLHVRPKHHRFCKRTRFDWILPPFGLKALADKNYGCMLIKIFQFAGGVHQQGLQLVRLIFGVHTHFAPIRELDPARTEFLPRLLAPFEMARNDHQVKVRKPLAQPHKNIGQHRLFSCVRTSPNQQPSPFRKAELTQQPGHIKHQVPIGRLTAERGRVRLFPVDAAVLADEIAPLGVELSHDRADGIGEDAALQVLQRVLHRDSVVERQLQVVRQRPRRRGRGRDCAHRAPPFSADRQAASGGYFPPTRAQSRDLLCRALWRPARSGGWSFRGG